MGNGGPRHAQKSKENEIPLPQLAKELKPAELEARLGKAFDRAIAFVKDSFGREASEYTKQVRKAGKDLELLADIFERVPQYLHIKMDLNTRVNGKDSTLVDKYIARIEELNSQTGISEAKWLREMAAIMKRAEADSVTVSVTFKTLRVETNPAYLSTLMKLRSHVIEQGSKVVQEGFNGRTTSFQANIGDEKLATLFATAFQSEVGIQRPGKLQEDERIAYEQATIHPAKLPLEVARTKRSITIGWPLWLVPGTIQMDLEGSELKGGSSSLVPRKTQKTV